MNERKQAKTWQTTRLQNLLRHKSGRYYARAFADGKEVWKSLKTSHFGVAEAKLTEFMKSIGSGPETGMARYPSRSERRD